MDIQVGGVFVFAVLIFCAAALVIQALRRVVRRLKTHGIGLDALRYRAFVVPDAVFPD